MSGGMPRRDIRILLFAVPVVLHAVWDMNFELPFYGKYLILGLAAWVIVINLVQTGLRQIGTLSSTTPET